MSGVSASTTAVAAKTTTAEWPDDEGGIQHAEMRRGDAAFTVFTVFTDRAGYDRAQPHGESVGFGLVFALGSPVEVDDIFRSAAAGGAEELNCGHRSPVT
jgi:uncharacterized glyoxalase superfamily protein PhnB